MNGVTEVRRATEADIDACASVLVRAFQDDPGTVLVEPDDARRREIFLPFFRTFIAASIADGGDIVVPEGELNGVASWFGPDAHGPSESSMVTHGLLETLGTFGDEATGRLGPMTGELEAQHARLMPERHLRLEFFGVDPDAQGRGIGVALAEHGHRRADALGLPCYLETMTERNVGFYERRGYGVIETFTVGDGVTVYAMRRDPQGG
jgi:ribosomal protein S18 acetylase RimI-like enzyme